MLSVSIGDVRVLVHLMQVDLQSLHHLSFGRHLYVAQQLMRHLGEETLDQVQPGSMSREPGEHEFKSVWHLALSPGTPSSAWMCASNGYPG